MATQQVHLGFMKHYLGRREGKEGGRRWEGRKEERRGANGGRRKGLREENYLDIVINSG